MDNKFPVKTDLTVFSADDCKSSKIGWVCREYQGGEVYGLDSEEKIVENPLTQENDLYLGKKIGVPTLFGYLIMEVIGDGNKFAAITSTKKTWANLEFAKDDRLCWTSSYSMNINGIKKINKLTNE